MAEEAKMQVVHYRDVQQALDECQREFNVRARCFPRWVGDGRVSATDAQDRLDRMGTAVKLLEQMIAPPPTPAEKPKNGTAKHAA
jgi:hypothetical protein